MSETLFVNRPGGVIARNGAGASVTLGYGDRVPEHLQKTAKSAGWADTQQRKPDIDPRVEAQRRAALAENGQVNSSSSPVPGNYSELDEGGKVALIRNLERFPEQQAAVIKHEQLFGGNNQKVIDSASAVARQIAGLTVAAELDAATDTDGEYEGEPVAAAPDATRGGAFGADRRGAAGVRAKVAAEGRVPSPTSGSTEDGGDEKLTGEALDARGAELEIEGFSSMKADEKREAIAKAEADQQGS